MRTPPASLTSRSPSTSIPRPSVSSFSRRANSMPKSRRWNPIQVPIQSTTTNAKSSRIMKDDPTLEELRGAIVARDDDEIINLIALAWVSRGDFDRREWPDARRLAGERHRRRSPRLSCRHTDSRRLSGGGACGARVFVAKSSDRSALTPRRTIELMVVRSA